MASDKLANSPLARAQLARAALRLGGRLVLMTDDERLKDPLAAARALPRGSLVIVRARHARHRAELAAALMQIARARKLMVLIAGDGPLALKVGAHGIHLSQVRARDAAHWRSRRPHWLITVSAHSLAACAASRHADAAVLAPVFATASHPGRTPLGALRTRIAVRASPVPVYALGGIDAHSVARLAGAKLAGLAAVGALA
ncbi:MAG TPA: thiamine phosphate synthase [Rhizomicrobium sp.]|nr:thiamine phosphate synthase [Rhizomicrobium sp.]